MKTKNISNNANRSVGAIISILNMVISVFIGMIYTSFASRTLGKSEYGVLTLSMSLIAYLSVFDMGFGNALVRYSSRIQSEGKEVKNLYGMFLSLFSAISVIVIAVGAVMYSCLEGFYSSSFSPEEIALLKPIFLILLINTTLSFPASVFSSIVRANEKFIFSQVVSLLQYVLMHIANIVILLLGYHSIAIALSSLIFSLMVYTANILYCFLKLHVKFGFKKFEKSFYKEVLLYSFFIFINLLITQLYDNTDKILLSKIVGSASVAIYGIGVTFQVYFQNLSTSISGVFLPHISKLSAKKGTEGEISDLFINVGRIQAVLLLLIFTGFAVYGREFIYLWVGPDYKDAYAIALIIMAPALIPLTQNIGISVLQAYNRHRIRSIMFMAIAIINVVLSIPLAMKWGGIGAAIGTFIGTLLGQILFMNWYYYKKINLDIPKYWKQMCILVLKYIPVAAIFALSSYLIPDGSWKFLILKIAAGVIVSVPYIFTVILNKSEKAMLSGMVQKLKRR